MLEMNHVNFSYDKQTPILKNIDFNVPVGKCILLCGESGCGKTTITKIINGLIPNFYNQGVFEGSVKVNHQDISSLKMYELAQNVGSVFQNPKSQFFHTISDAEIVFGLENGGMAVEKIQKRYKEVIAELQINYLTCRSVFAMSGGEKQQLAFASVYAMNPQVFVLDEPTANIDQEAIVQLTKTMMKMKQMGHTIIIAEHRLYFLNGLIDQAVYIQNGQIKHIYDGKSFFLLNDKQRIDMGLRSLKKETLKITGSQKINQLALLEITDLSCSYKKTILFEHLDMSINSGEILGIVGKNGVGKSTLCRCIAGLHKQKNGTIKWRQKTVNEKKRRQLCAMVMQDVNHQLFFESVIEECYYASYDKDEQKINELLDELDLLAYKDHHPMSLSGGQKQRLAVVLAILSDKKIIIFDEPTSGLDYRRMMSVSKQIKKLSQRGCCVMIVSHDIEFMNQTCHRIYQL